MDKVSGSYGQSAISGGGGRCLAVGYSVRALAEALRDTGFRVIAIDAFGDYDTRESSEVPQIITNWGAANAENSLQLESWPIYRQLPNVGETAEKLPVFLGGGCENWPQLLEFLLNRELFQALSLAPSELSRIRNPELLMIACREGKIRFPATLFNAANASADHHGNWLLKRKRSAGGLGVYQWDLSALSLDGDSSYLQAYVPGRVLGVSCLMQALPAQTTVRFIGATESWQADDCPGPSRFIYRGSFGPVELSPSQQREIVELVERLIEVCAFSKPRGWIQMDFVEDAEGRLWLLEVNPRWSAGMEILLLSGLANMARLHAQAFSASSTPSGRQVQLNDNTSVTGELNRWIAKSIYYVDKPIKLSSSLIAKLQEWYGRGLSDIPSVQQTGNLVEVGQPLVTIQASLERQAFNYSQARTALLQQLMERRLKLEQMLS